MPIILKPAIVISLLVVYAAANSQNVEMSYHKPVNDFVQTLVASHIDTICVYEEFSENRQPAYVQYVFWKDHGITNANKFDENAIYMKREIGRPDFWAYFFANAKAINDETTEAFGYTEKTNGKKQDYTIVEEATDVKQFKVYVAGTVVSFWGNEYDFKKSAVIKNKKRLNIYFRRNNSLKGRHVIDKLEKLGVRISKR